MASKRTVKTQFSNKGSLLAHVLYQLSNDSLPYYSIQTLVQWFDEIVVLGVSVTERINLVPTCQQHSTINLSNKSNKTKVSTTEKI